MASLLFLQRFFDIPWLFNAVRNLIDRKQVDELKKIIESFKIEKILDVGCGTGMFCGITDKKYVGVDTVPSFIEYAIKKYGSKNKKFILMNATNIIFKAKEFDAVILVDFIHHIPNDVVVNILKNAANVSKKVIIWDAIPQKNFVSQIFYALDRGKYMRSLNEQIELVRNSARLKVVKVAEFRSFPWIYLHSIIICEPTK